MECLYIMESFGIPSKHLPVNLSTEKIELEDNNRWLDMCVAKEKNPKLLTRVVECPNYHDILFGRGQIVMNHPGNIMFRDYIQSKLDLYTNIRSKKESTQWTWGVVRTFKTQYGARFLKEERIDTDVTAWVEVSNEVARSKVRIAFRDARSRLAKCAEKQHNNNKSNGISVMKTEEVDTCETAMKSSSCEGKNFKGTTPDKPVSSKMSSFNLVDSKATQQMNASDVNIIDIHNNLRELNDNLRHLNGNLNAITGQQQNVDSSTSSFLNFENASSENECFCFNSFNFK